MKIVRAMVIMLAICTVGFLSSCESNSSDDDDDGDGDGGGDDSTVTETLVFSGVVDRPFDTNTQTLTASFSNAAGADFYLTDETDDTIYQTDANEANDATLNFNYTDTTHLDHLYNPTDYGYTSSNPEAKVTSVVIEIEGSGDDIFHGNLSTLPAKWYYYMYASADTVLSGSYDDEDETHTFSNVQLLAGWNRLIVTTSDGLTFAYTSGGEIADPKWTHMKN